MSLTVTYVKLAFLYPTKNNDLDLFRQYVTLSENVYIPYTSEFDFNSLAAYNACVIDSGFSRADLWKICFELKKIKKHSFIIVNQKNKIDAIYCYENGPVNLLYQEYPQTFWSTIVIQLDASGQSEKKVVQHEDSTLLTQLTHTLRVIEGVLWEVSFTSGKLQSRSMSTGYLGWERRLINDDNWSSLIHPNDIKMVEDQFYIALNTRSDIHIECRMQTAAGDYKWIRSFGSYYKDAKTGEESIIGVAYNNHELKTKDLQLKESLKTKESLLSEIFHRVNNNLQIIMSLIKFQVDQAKDEERKFLNDISKKILSLSLAHEQLSFSQSISQIPLKIYLYNLIMYNCNFESAKERVEVSVTGHDILLHMDKVIPVGVLIVELFGLSQNYTYKEVKKRVLNINLVEHKNFIEIQYVDHEPTKTNSALKMPSPYNISLINLLLKQIDASLEFRSSTFFNLVLKLPLKNYEKTSSSKTLGSDLPGVDLS